MMIGPVQFLCLAILASWYVYADATEPCDPYVCRIEYNCRCSSPQGPLSLDQTPQLITLALVGAVTQDLYRTRWAPLVGSRLNPDGDYVGATLYVNHEYTDYQKVADLIAMGFEIGVHSITNNPLQSYWRHADQLTLEQEFGGQRRIISKFANIPSNHITGVMTPQLQLAGDTSIYAFTSQGFLYDNSWGTEAPLFPYTFDNASTQECDLGSKCPTQSHRGFWEAPIIDLTADDGDVCSTLAGCFRKNREYTAQEVSDWLYNEIQKIKRTNKAPMTLVIEPSWFENVNTSYAGLTDALDRLGLEKDVFFVSQARTIEWIKDPVPLDLFKTNSYIPDINCNPVTCKLIKSPGVVRYMSSCVPCPKAYPWLGNPDGN